MRAGSTVVQAYIHDLEASVERPTKELKAFAKVYLEAGRRTTVRFALDMRSLAYFDDRRSEWCAEPGEFELLVGQSSVEFPLRARFTLVQGWREAVGQSRLRTLGA